ncbi:MAG: AAA family ATPase [Betaproteobacteria bacterium]
MTGVSEAALAQGERNRRACAEQRALVEALRDPACFAHPVGSVSLIETHISFVILTGSIAYKIKKPVDFGFLDFTTLEKRRFFCSEERRLNARFAARIYLDVVPIGGTREHPLVEAKGAAIEYAVKLRQFPQEALGDRVLARGELTLLHMDALAELLAGFHARAGTAAGGDPFGSPEAIQSSVVQNFSQILDLPISAAQLSIVNDTQTWARNRHASLCKVFARRKREGRVRECHGDLHLGNIVILDGAPLPFDCIEFNPDLRWIDVMNEVAFMVMDLRAADRADLANRFLNAYLESCGDYDGLRVLDYYVAYRAMVRAKIGMMRAGQIASGGDAAAPRQPTDHRYLALAYDCGRSRAGFIAITHGFSGSGKTTLSRSLAELNGAIRVRSDIERKRMQGMASTDRGEAGMESDLYSADATDATYRRLLDLAQVILDSGHGVIVDATFLQRRHRELFRACAALAGVPFAIVDFTASEALLRERIGKRGRLDEDASDADQAVLEHQLRRAEALQSDELATVFAYDTSRSVEDSRQPQTWAPLLRRLSSAGALLP